MANRYWVGGGTAQWVSGDDGVNLSTSCMFNRHNCDGRVANLHPDSPACDCNCHGEVTGRCQRGDHVICKSDGVTCVCVCHYYALRERMVELWERACT